MTWANRLKLAAGMLAVLVVVAACTVVFNQRQHRAQSDSAVILAQSYPVGTDYGGIVTEQYVQIGDEVEVGDRLFSVRSLQLQRDVASGFVVDADVLAAVDDAGTTAVVATVNGTVGDIRVPQGGFAQSGSQLATIDRDGSLFVEAELLMSPRDYARIGTGTVADILLPNQASLQGTIARVDVETVDGQALSTVRIESDALVDGLATGLFQPGTPVEVSVQLRDDGPLSGVADAVRDLLRKIGL